jgi:rhamnose transport system permease protein
MLLVVFAGAAFIAGSLLSPVFLDIGNLLDATTSYVEVGLLALALTPLLIAGQIDLSIAAITALSGVMLGRSLQAGAPIPVAIAIAIVVGACCGLVNGLLVNRSGLPSLVVTLATSALYGGVAQGLVGYVAITGLPEELLGLDLKTVPFTPIPFSLAILAAAAVLYSWLLHAAIFGRKVFLIGRNRHAATFAGIDVKRTEWQLFLLSGLTASVAAVLLVSRSGVVVYNLAGGMLLSAITVVVVGGVSILGGSGSIGGTILALALIIFLQRGMGFAGVPDQVQLIVVGLLLIVTVALPELMRGVFRLRARRRAHAEAAVAPEAGPGGPP